MTDVKAAVQSAALAMKQRAKEPLGNIPSLEPVLVGSLGDAWPYLARACVLAFLKEVGVTEKMDAAGEDAAFDVGSSGRVIRAARMFTAMKSALIQEMEGE